MSFFFDQVIHCEKNYIFKKEFTIGYEALLCLKNGFGYRIGHQT